MSGPAPALSTEAGRPAPGRLPHAELAPDLSARVEDATEASLLHGRGFYGEVGDGGKLTLDPRETAYLREMDRIDLAGPDGLEISFPDLMKRAQRLDPGFEILYLVYRDLRQRGYVVRPGPPPFPFALLPRGGDPGEDPVPVLGLCLLGADPLLSARPPGEARRLPGRQAGSAFGRGG